MIFLSFSGCNFLYPFWNSSGNLNEILLVRNQKTSGNWPLRDVRFWIFLAKKGLQFSGINGNILKHRTLSSVGRALPWRGRGQGFESLSVHHDDKDKLLIRQFFLCLFWSNSKTQWTQNEVLKQLWLRISLLYGWHQSAKEIPLSFMKLQPLISG